MKFRGLPVLGVLFLALAGFSSAQTNPVRLRVGAFANITHSQAMVGKSMGWFEKQLGPSVRIEWSTFNAGPSEIEAVFAGAIDLGYIGPNPAVSGYVHSHGEALRVIAGATSGGAAMVVRGDSGINNVEDFHRKRIASPQMGNTQDVSLRYWLISHGMKSSDKGGDVQVIPIANADQLTLFLRKQLDAAWAPEPWASRLIHEANGRLFLDERDLWPNHQFVTAHVIVRSKFLQEHPDIVKKFLAAHVELTDWINAHPSEAKRAMNAQIQKETGKALSADVLDEAFGRMQVTYDPIRSSLLTSAKWAFEAGFLGRQMPDLSGLYDLTVLNQVLREKGKRAVQ